MKRIERITTHTRGLLPLIIALLFGGVALCHAQAPEKVLRGIRYTRTGEGTCRASMVKDDVYKSYIVNPTVTINGEECRVTSISDMGINAIAGENYDDYRYKYVRYEIKFPEFVDTICAYCFQAYGVNECWDFTIWKELSFPKSRVIESYAFSTCVGDIVIPEGVEELGYKINGECEYGPNILSLPSTLKRMSALAVTLNEGVKPPIFWSTTPAEIIPLSNGNTFPINDIPSYAAIYVPEVSIEAYKNAQGWCDIPDIRPIKVNALENVATDKEVRFEVSDSAISAVNGLQPVEVYTTDGRCVAVGTDGTVSGLNVGLYIVRCGATVSKVYVR